MIPFKKPEPAAMNGSTVNSCPLKSVIIKAVHTLTKLTESPAFQMAERFLHLITPNAAVRPDANTKIE